MADNPNKVNRWRKSMHCYKDRVVNETAIVHAKVDIRDKDELSRIAYYRHCRVSALVREAISEYINRLTNRRKRHG